MRCTTKLTTKQMLSLVRTKKNYESGCIESRDNAHEVYLKDNDKLKIDVTRCCNRVSQIPPRSASGLTMYAPPFVSSFVKSSAELPLLFPPPADAVTRATVYADTTKRT